MPAEPELARRFRRDVGRTARALSEANELPAPSDLRTLFALPGSQVQVLVYGRRVSGRELWVWYQATSSELRLEALTREL